MSSIKKNRIKYLDVVQYLDIISGGARWFNSIASKLGAIPRE